MKFYKIGRKAAMGTKPAGYLRVDLWNDYSYITQFDLTLFDGSESVSIGQIKIGKFGMTDFEVDIPDEFEALDESYFSLGQDNSYYEALKALDVNKRLSVLTSLRDVAYDAELFDRAESEPVMRKSLLRFVAATTVRQQYRRLANGGARLSRFNFSFEWRASLASQIPSRITFNVEPESQPPSNIHVLIGRNGVGKTTLLHRMTRALLFGANSDGGFAPGAEHKDKDLFASVVSVTFSAFDPFEPEPKDASVAEIKYAYIGLKQEPKNELGRPSVKNKSYPSSLERHSGAMRDTLLKDDQQLAREFSDSVENCRSGGRAQRWRSALRTLESDSNFRDAAVLDLVGEVERSGPVPNSVELFNKLSSGHKIVLLTITRLVETVEERTLVLLDEPETHLHPPLLSAFIRALSDLLVSQNAVAIVATHSPVVLQEVPRHCVWKLNRSGDYTEVERPEIETFGENVGVLTREVFGLEVSSAGFHKLLRTAIDENASYEQVEEQFNGELGGEAKAIVRALLAIRRSADL